MTERWELRRQGQRNNSGQVALDGAQCRREKGASKRMTVPRAEINTRTELVMN